MIAIRLVRRSKTALRFLTKVTGYCVYLINRLKFKGILIRGFTLESNPEKLAYGQETGHSAGIDSLRGDGLRVFKPGSEQRRFLPGRSTLQRSV